MISPEEFERIVMEDLSEKVASDFLIACMGELRKLGFPGWAIARLVEQEWAIIWVDLALTAADNGLPVETILEVLEIRP